MNLEDLTLYFVGIQALAADIHRQFNASKDPREIELLGKVYGLLFAAIRVCALPHIPRARKLELAAINTLLRGYGVKNAPRGKRL